MIGRLQRVPLREVWPHEAHAFTVWMEEHVDVLGETLGLSFASVQREQSTGVFSVDLVAETEGGVRVVVENQLERSDHDHLGKLITYLAAFDAGAAVWVTPDARPEHVQAVAWLNESTAASFYLVKVEAVRIGDSAPAPLFTLIVGPSEEAREIGERKREMDETQHRYVRFWTGVIERDPQANRTPPKNYWLGTGVPGLRRMGYFYVVLKERSRVELYVDDEPERNQAVFEFLRGRSAAIEEAFEAALDWDPMDGRRACRVAYHFTPGWGGSEERDWPVVQGRMVEHMGRLRGALQPHLDALPPALR